MDEFEVLGDVIHKDDLPHVRQLLKNCTEETISQLFKPSDLLTGENGEVK